MMHRIARLGRLIGRGFRTVAGAVDGLVYQIGRASCRERV